MGQSRLCTFFESIGWRVYRVPETLSIFKGIVDWNSLPANDKIQFYENALRTMLRVEDTFFNMASTCQANCLVICDGGSMDLIAHLTEGEWKLIMKRTGWNNVDLRDNRYNHVIHMDSSAKGSDQYYRQSSNNKRNRADVVAQAAKLDDLYSQAWVGHPYFSVIDNSTDFERKIVRMISSVCNHLGIEPGDRLSLDSKKRKFLIGSLPDKTICPQFQDFIVAHDYLATPNHKMQARIRRRGQNGNWTYTHTIRRPDVNLDQTPETRIEITLREYELLLAQKHPEHCTVYKKRRCFLWNNQYFQMDIYQEPCPQRCKGLVMLETYTSLKGSDFKLPDFLDIVREVTDDPAYSMYNLSKIDGLNGDTKNGLASPASREVHRHNGYLKELKLKDRYLDKIRASVDKNWSSSGRLASSLGKMSNGVDKFLQETGDGGSDREINDVVEDQDAPVSQIVDSLDIAKPGKTRSPTGHATPARDTLSNNRLILGNLIEATVTPDFSETRGIGKPRDAFLGGLTVSHCADSYKLHEHGLNGIGRMKPNHLVSAEGCE